MQKATAGPFTSVTVFGGATLDRIARSNQRLLLGASNPGTVRRLPGGVAFNVASILARLGIPARLVSRVGDDPEGQAVLAAAMSAGVDTGGMSLSPTARTGSYHATFDDAGNLVVGIADMAICDEITPAVLTAAATEDRGHELWAIDANLPPETLAFLVAEATATKRPVAALTTSPVKAQRWMPLLDQLSYLFANRREAAVLLGLNPEAPDMPTAQLADKLAEGRHTKVAVTNGTEPLVAACGSDRRSFAVLRALVKTVNGAGDSLAAGTINGLVQGRAFADAIRLGLAAAAMTLESGGVAFAPFSPGSLTERIAAPPKQAVA